MMKFDVNLIAQNTTNYIKKFFITRVLQYRVCIERDEHMRGNIKAQTRISLIFSWFEQTINYFSIQFHISLDI